MVGKVEKNFEKKEELGNIQIQNGGHMSILLSIFLACGEKDHDHDTSADTAAEPSSEASTEPSGEASSEPSSEASSEPSGEASSEPSSEASSEPSSEASSEPAGEPSGEPVGDAANGESIVNAKCMGCHASNPAIGDSSNMTDDELINLFDNGKGYMPPQSLTEQEKLDVIAYLRQEYGGN